MGDEKHENIYGMTHCIGKEGPKIVWNLDGNGVVEAQGKDENGWEKQ